MIRKLLKIFKRKKPAMITGITIHLSDPICKCDSKLSWTAFEILETLVVHCKQCETQVHLPFKKLNASIKIENNKDTTPTKPRPELLTFKLPEKK